MSSASPHIASTWTELYRHVALETARMAYPGSMSRGTKPLVLRGAKRELEKYFMKGFPLREVWVSAPKVASTYEDWHKSRTAEIAKAIGEYVPDRNKSTAVATKFLDTFMHQLMKYEPCRALWPVLHLPLDSRVCAALAQMKSPSLSRVGRSFSKSPYLLRYDEYLRIQRALKGLVLELNARTDAEFKIESRIELNCLLWK